MSKNNCLDRVNYRTGTSDRNRQFQSQDFNCTASRNIEGVTQEGNSVRNKGKSDTSKINLLRLYYTNCRSLCNKKDELRTFVSNENIDIIALTETWINTESRYFLAEFHIPGYSLFKRD